MLYWLVFTLIVWHTSARLQRWIANPASRPARPDSPKKQMKKRLKEARRLAKAIGGEEGRAFRRTAENQIQQEIKRGYMGWEDD